MFWQVKSRILIAIFATHRIATVLARKLKECQENPPGRNEEHNDDIVAAVEVGIEALKAMMAVGSDPEFYVIEELGLGHDSAHLGH